MAKPSDKFMRLNLLKRDPKLSTLKHTTTDFLDGGLLRKLPDAVNGWRDNYLDLKSGVQFRVKESAEEIEIEYNRAMLACEKDGKKC